MLELAEVTLVCVDCVNHTLALRAMARSLAGIRYARAVFLTDALPEGVDVPEGVEVVNIPPLLSRDEYSLFVVRSLLPHVASSHALVMQWDGYVVNPGAWDPRFLDCDYLGAKWFWQPEGMRVGNGGFSLRSRRLLQALQDPRIIVDDVEDNVICQKYRSLLEQDHAIRFGSEELADRFSFEAAYPIGTPFGFHGLFNFWRTVDADELAALAPTFSDAIARSPQAIQLARNCTTLGVWPAAAALAARILAARPDDTEAEVLLATAERNRALPPAVGRNDPCPCGSGRKFKQCHGALDRPADAPPATAPPSSPTPDVGAFVRAAMAEHQRGDLESAERHYRAALDAAPGLPTATHYLGVILFQRHRLDDALPLLEQSCAAVPEEPEFHNNLGLALAAADRNDEAVAAYRRALELRPRHIRAWNNLGLAYAAMNRPDDAIAAYRTALETDDGFGQAHWNLALSLLLTGEFVEGWREYEWRHQIAEFQGKARDKTLWDGTPTLGLTLLLEAEQGIGDAVQFIRFAEPVAQRGVRVIVRTQPALVHLLKSARGVAAAVSHDEPVPEHDARLPLLSLPGLLGVAVDRIAAAVPYLSADPARRAMAAAMLANHAGRLKVGLAWAGNRSNSNDSRRSAPLAALAPLFSLPGISWFSLQKGEAERDVADVPAASALIPLPPENTYDDTAALVAELDLVISVDTGVAHLAGAFGKPTWVLLAYAADWRWHLDPVRSVWYPTARLFRQPGIGAWDSVVADVVAALSTPR